MSTLQEIADQRTDAIKTAQRQHAEQIAEYGLHARLQAVWDELTQAALTPRCGEKAAQAIPLVAQAIRNAGRLPRFDAAALNARTDDQLFIVAIMRQALTGTVTAADWNLYDGSLVNAQVWLYDQVAMGFWNEPPMIPEPAEPAPVDPASVPTEDDAADPNRKSVRLSHWALAIGEKQGEWYIFQWFGNKQRWASRGLAEIPRGIAAQFAELLAKGGGAVGKSDAIKNFHVGDRKEWKAKDVFDKVCKRSRMDLAAALRDNISRVTGQNKPEIGDPIPWCRQEKTWRATVQVGYACRDDDSELRFRHADQIQGGFSNEERRPS